MVGPKSDFHFAKKHLYFIFKNTSLVKKSFFQTEAFLIELSENNLESKNTSRIVNHLLRYLHYYRNHSQNDFYERMNESPVVKMFLRTVKVSLKKCRYRNVCCKTDKGLLVAFQWRYYASPFLLHSTLLSGIVCPFFPVRFLSWKESPRSTGRNRERHIEKEFVECRRLPATPFIPHIHMIVEQSQRVVCR